ncbi:MAG: ribonuclease III [Dehalococcoidales bacterium]|nr:ribonuclease III [Dehalococcoidales bacterium]
MPDLAALQKVLGVSFSNPSLLEQSLIHSSYINENPGITPHSNERLEFLGDAVLGLVVAERLYQKLPHLAEGKMTRFRAALVRREALASMARAIKLGDYLYLGKGEEAGGGRQRPLNLAGVMEAVIAAIFLDRGLPAVRDFILKQLAPELEKVISRGDGIDYKSELQEFVQAQEQQTPAYHVIQATGPDHNRKFTIEVRLGDRVLGLGSGNSKKAAESEAARAALAKIAPSFTA